MTIKKAGLGVRERHCPKCGKTFSPMSERQWEVVLLLHLAASKKHHQYRSIQAGKLPISWSTSKPRIKRKP